MSDEFYRCAECGEFEAGTHTGHQHEDTEEIISQHEYEELTEEEQQPYQEISICDACGQPYEGICVARTRED